MTIPEKHAEIAIGYLSKRPYFTCKYKPMCLFLRVLNRLIGYPKRKYMEPINGRLIQTRRVRKLKDSLG